MGWLEEYYAPIEYREPVFTFDQAKKSWGEGYWALDGYKMLLWVKRSGFRTKVIDTSGIWDYRPKMGPIATRNVCWVKEPDVGEIPIDITEDYTPPDLEHPDNLTMEELEEYILRKSWALLFFQWNSMSIPPGKFSTLLNKIILTAEYLKRGLVLFDTQDLYVNVNPYDFQSKYDKPYPVDDLEKQKDLYNQWLTYAGFMRYYIVDPNTKYLIETPWYYRIPDINGDKTNVGIPEDPVYQVHPIEITAGTFYPIGYHKPGEKEPLNKNEIVPRRS